MDEIIASVGFIFLFFMFVAVAGFLTITILVIKKETIDFYATIARIEIDLICDALSEATSIAHAARMLSLNRTTLMYKMDTYKLTGFSFCECQECDNKRADMIKGAKSLYG
jgi:hypothetical protein